MPLGVTFHPRRLVLVIINIFACKSPRRHAIRDRLSAVRARFLDHLTRLINCHYTLKLLQMPDRLCIRVALIHDKSHLLCNNMCSSSSPGLGSQALLQSCIATLEESRLRSPPQSAQLVSLNRKLYARVVSSTVQNRKRSCFELREMIHGVVSRRRWILYDDCCCC